MNRVDYAAVRAAAVAQSSNYSLQSVFKECIRPGMSDLFTPHFLAQHLFPLNLSLQASRRSHKASLSRNNMWCNRRWKRRTADGAIFAKRSTAWSRKVLFAPCHKVLLRARMKFYVFFSVIKAHSFPPAVKVAIKFGSFEAKSCVRSNAIMKTINCFITSWRALSHQSFWSVCLIK